MSIQAVRPKQVNSVNELTKEELTRFNAVWVKTEKNLRQNQNIPKAYLNAVLEATASSVTDFALKRGFYNDSAASSIQIDVQVAPKLIVQKKDSIESIIKKTFIQSIFQVLSWTLSEANPLVGIALFATSAIVNSDACKDKIDKS